MIMAVKNFQSLETRCGKVPTIGKMRGKSSNHWKFSGRKFQSLEVLGQGAWPHEG